jgi:hypothetical protein
MNCCEPSGVERLYTKYTRLAWANGYSTHGKKFLENENKEASGKLGMCETPVPFLLMILAQYTLPLLLE